MTARRFAAAVAAVTAALCLLTVAVVAPAPASAAAGCDAGTPAVPELPDGATPVVYVHGWRASGASLDGDRGPADLLYQALQPGYQVLRFDYRDRNTEWPAGQTALCLAEYVVKAWEAGRRARKVVVVAHSMGGLATRFAAEQIVVDGVPVSSVLAGLVSIGTPHRGSPWGGTPWAELLQFALPQPGSSAATCLAGPFRKPPPEPPCAVPPYLPDGVAVHQIGSQITIKRTLFGIPAVGGTAEIPLYGDGVVPQDSAQGYPRSVPDERTPPGIRISSGSVACGYDTDYVLAAALGAKGGTGGGPAGALIGGEAATPANIMLDDAALRDMQAGRASPALAELTLLAQNTPCFHTRMLTEPRVVADAATAIRAMDTGAAQPTRLTNLAPVVDGGPAPGWTVTDELDTTADCGQPSGSAVSDGIQACSPSAAWAVACWPKGDGSVLCLRDPWDRTLVRYPANNTDVAVTALPDPAPLAIALDDGRHCFIRTGGAWGSYEPDPELLGAYSCTPQSDEQFVWAGDRTFNEDSPAWTVQVGGTSGPLQTRTVTEAYFAA